MDYDRPRFRCALSVLLLLSVSFAAPSFAYQQFEFVREIGEAGKKAPQRLLNEPRALRLPAAAYTSPTPRRTRSSCSTRQGRSS